MTAVDKQVDELFHRELGKIDPAFGFITEESTAELSREYNWVVDPIDGTTNFSRGIPIFGISVALTRDLIPVYGMLDLPMSATRIHAWEGGGLYLNNQSFKSPTRPIPAKPLVTIAPVAYPEDHAGLIRLLGERLAAPRDLGSCVYQSCMTIIGRIDVVIAYKLSLWDISAAVLLAREAGLGVEFISPEPHLVRGVPAEYAHTIILGLPPLVTKLAPHLRSYISASS